MSDLKPLETLFQLVHRLKREFHTRIEQLDSGLTPMHTRVLKVIHHKSPCTAIDVATVLHRDKAQVTRLLNSLIEQEMITKHANPEDKRSQFLRLTNRGEALMEQILEINDELSELMTAGLSEGEIREFQRIADKMTHQLSQNE
jgi:DNA-binding MarR family transcriptional regulator